MHEPSFKLRRTWRSVHRRVREWGMILKGLASTDHPVLAHVIPMRRCNLACGYCNEYDDVSKPVPIETMYQRLDHLADMGTNIITISGGEPLLHPDLDLIVGRIRRRGMIAGMITNGYLLVADRIKRLNDAGLDHLQISIDNIMPDDVSKKSLKVLDKKLQLLSQHALFHVNINSVVGGGIKDPHDALVVAKRALELGFTSTVGIIHDGGGQLRPLGGAEREVYTPDARHGKSELCANQLFPGQHRARQGKQLALPRRRAILIHLRRRLSALLLAAARLSRQAADGIHTRGCPPRVPHRQKLRPALHGCLRAPDFLHRFLARRATSPARPPTS